MAPPVGVSEVLVLRTTKVGGLAIKFLAARDVTPAFHPAATRGRPVLSRMSAGRLS